ncbi:DUF349 domain-containing protein [Ornithinimicrobium faecis]|uniref:DUF349 domain-containing protein n=1 Tax=Ornithinimicrobium faecis TaxID=2934158 RepID=UPI002119B5CC|nr:DUF349 domain-containing protein [Ornithinimicrobium sp. HY1745]
MSEQPQGTNNTPDDTPAVTEQSPATVSEQPPPQGTTPEREVTEPEVTAPAPEAPAEQAAPTSEAPAETPAATETDDAADDVTDTPAEPTAPSAETETPAPDTAPTTDAPSEASEAPVEQATPTSEAPAETPEAPVEQSTPAVETPAVAAPEAPVQEAASTMEAPVEQAATTVEAPEAPAEATAEAEEPSAPSDAPKESTEAAPASATPAPAAAAPDATPAPTPAPKPKPGPVPSPAALAGRKPAVTPAVPAAPAVPATTDSITFGRVAEDGTVFVKDGEEERAVGSYPEASHDEALAYFARKYDELAAGAQLLEQRLGQTEISAHEARESLKTLRDQIGEANVVGNLAVLRERVTAIEAAVKERQRNETEARATAKAEATTVREALVVEAETLAAADVHQIQWKSASGKMRGMLDQWRGLQKKGPKLDKDVENALWQRLSAARSTFDKNRKAFFSELDTQHSEAKRVKEKLVVEAEALSSSKEWGPTAGAFKRLMQDWRRAGRAQRSDDDALWERFRTAQDAFFNAKDEVVAAENEEFSANLVVKEELLTEAEALLPVTDLEAAKSALRGIQDRWEEAGKVPRSDMSRVEGRLRKVEQAVRDQEDAKWKKTNPELNARAQSMVEQLERAVQGLEQDLEAARATGNDKKIAEAQAALEARQGWLDSARGGLSEFGG